jgi:hypothetical protein
MLNEKPLIVAIVTTFLATAWSRRPNIVASLAIALATIAGSTVVPQSARAAPIVDSFQEYAVGTFPSPTWQDVGTVDPEPPIAPVPSGTIIETTNAFGQPTRAFEPVSSLASSAGIYSAVPVSTSYTLSANMRVDQYSNAPASTVQDWAMQLTFAQVGVNFAYAPEFGLYASSLTQDWRLYFTGAATGYADIDLGVAAPIGEWFTVKLSLDATDGAYDAIIIDTATGQILTNSAGILPDWTAADDTFDSIAFFKGDLSPGDTIGDTAAINDVDVTATVPEPFTLSLFGAGLAGAGALRRRKKAKA